MQAAENGDNVLLCEGQSFMGGNGLGVECTNAYGLHPNSEGVSLGEMVAAEAKEQAYTTNQMFTRDMISHAADNVQWLIDDGVQVAQPTEELDEAYLAMYKEGHYGATYSFEYVYANGAAGQGFFPYMKKKLAEYGVNLRLGARRCAASSRTPTTTCAAPTQPTRSATSSRSTPRPSSWAPVASARTASTGHAWAWTSRTSASSAPTATSATAST